jgi:UDP-galactopyranose mutase
MHDTAPWLPNCNPGPLAYRSHPYSQKKIELTGLTTVAQNYPNPALDWTQTNETPALDQTQTNQTPLIMWKAHVAHDCEHG